MFNKRLMELSIFMMIIVCVLSFFLWDSLFSQVVTVPYRIRMADSTYSAKLVGRTASRTAGLTINGIYKSTFLAHQFDVTIPGRYFLYYDPLGDSSWVLDASWSGPVGKAIYTDYFMESIDPDYDNAVSSIDDSVISLQKMTTAAINYINAAGGGSITNNPDDISLENKSGSTIGVKHSFLTDSIFSVLGDSLGLFRTEMNDSIDAIDSTNITDQKLSANDIYSPAAYQSDYRVFISNASGNYFAKIDSHYIENGTVDPADLWSSTMAIDGDGLTQITGVTFGQTNTGLNVNVDGTTIQITNDTLSVVPAGLSQIDPETQIIATGGLTGEVLVDNGGYLVFQSIDSTSLGANCVLASELADNSVASANIINDAVTSVDILDSTIAGSNIAAGQISGFHLIDNFEGDGLVMEALDSENQIMHVNVDAQSVQITTDTLEINAVYANMHQGDDPDTVTIASSGTYYDIKEMDASEESHMSVAIELGTITIPYTGVYAVSGSFSFGGTSGAIMNISLVVDDAPDTTVTLQRKLGAAGDIGSASCFNVHSFTAGEVLNFAVTSDDNSDIFIFRNSQIAVYMIGK